MSVYEDQPVSLRLASILIDLGHILGESDSQMPAQMNEKRSEHCDMMLCWDAHQVQLTIRQDSEVPLISIHLDEETEITVKHYAVVGYCVLRKIEHRITPHW